MYGSWNEGVVELEFGDSVSVVCAASLFVPPMMTMPEGESQDTERHRGTPSWWLVSHWPVKVEQVEGVSSSSLNPPHSVSPSAEWP